MSDSDRDNDNQFPNDDEDIEQPRIPDETLGEPTKQPTSPDPDIEQQPASQPKEPSNVELFDDRRIRLYSMSLILLWFVLLGWWKWFDKTSPSANDAMYNQDFVVGYNLHAAGLFFVFIALLILLLFLFKKIENEIYNSILGITFILGAFFYFVGGCVLTGSYNNVFNSGVGSVIFGESFFITIYIIIIAADIRRNALNTLSQRVLTNFLLFLLCSTILFFSYASIDNPNGSTKAISTGYFFFMFLTLLFLVKFTVLKNNPNIIAKSNRLNSLFSILIIIFAFVGACGYWSYSGNQKTSNYQAYYIGYGFFILDLAIFMAVDITFGVQIKNRLKK